MPSYLNYKELGFVLYNFIEKSREVQKSSNKLRKIHKNSEKLGLKLREKLRELQKS